MARKQVIKPDFTINNMNAANNDPGVRTKVTPSFDFRSLVFSANANSKIFAADASMNDVEFGDASDDVKFSFSVWMKRTLESETQTHFYSGTYNGGYYFGINSGNNVRVTLLDGSNANTFVSPLVDGDALFDNELNNWVHLTLVYTPDSDNSDSNHTEQIQFYKNGSPWGSAIVSPNDNYVAMHPVTDNGDRFTIGSYDSGNTAIVNRFVGEMSNYLIFRHDGQSSRSSSVLTDSEVLALYNDGVPMRDYTKHSKGGDLVAYWKLDEDLTANPAPTQITDYSGQDNHLSNIGSAITSQPISGLRFVPDPLLYAQPRMIIPGLSSLRTNP